MLHPQLSRMRAFFFPYPSPTPRNRDQEGGYRDEEDESIWKEEHQQQQAEQQKQKEKHEQKQKGEETPFPCRSFMNTALTYINHPTYTHIPLSSTTVVSSSSSSSSSPTQTHEQGINIHPLATAFADLAVEAGIYGTRESYIEVLSFQLRRMVRSLGAQCRVLEQEGRGGGGGGRSLMITVTRAELNCTVHIEIQTRRKCVIHHQNHNHELLGFLNFLNREREETVVLVALSPVVKPAEGGMGLGLEGSGGEGDGQEGVFSVWRWREMRFGGGGVGGEEKGKGWKVCRGEDLGWGLRGMEFGSWSGMGRVGYKDDNEGERELVGDSEGEIENEKEEVGERKIQAEEDDKNGIRAGFGRNWMKSRQKRGRGGGKRKRKSVLRGGDKGIEVTWEWEEEKSLL